MTDHKPTPTEVLAACRAHGTTARGWRILAASLDATHAADAAECRATADHLDAIGELWGKPEPVTVRIPVQTLDEVAAEWRASQAAR